ncbi:MAG: hypothetical protein ACOH10_10415 [Rhodoglobus sp.]
MGLYTVLSSAEILSVLGNWWDNAPNPFVASAVLTDGTYCLAVFIEGPTTNTIRVYHLSKGLTILGSTDYVIPTTASWPIPYLVALPGNKVFLFSQVLLTRISSGVYSRTYATWIVDCSGNVPAMGSAIPMATNLNLGGNGNMSGGFFHVYDQASDRVILTNPQNALPGVSSNNNKNRPAVLSFRASTGVLLAQFGCTADQDSYIGGGSLNATGFYMNPSDPTKFGLPDTNGATLWFTVSLDGTSITYDGTFFTSQPGPWSMAGGSPYLAGGGGFIDYPSSSYTYVSEAAGVLSSSPLEVSMDWHGQSISSAKDQCLAFIDQGYGPAYPVRFFGVDQLANPPVIERIDLPFPPSDYNWDTGGNPVSILSVDQTTGIILVAVIRASPSYLPGEVWSYRYHSVFLWVIQGPVAKGGVPPLRQRARDDGLTTGSRQERSHGTSLQSSARRGGRTYY